MTRFSDLKGLTITGIIGATPDSERIVFESSDGRRFNMYHYQSCCENVSLESVEGDVNDLIGSEILQAEEESNHSETEDGSQTWTFYKIATVKGYVTLRWLGSSNGYYAESVDFEEMT